MQQTDKYKLNLIETTDPLSPAPLNENTQKTEGALDAQDARIIRLENCRIVVGQYRGTGKETIFDLGERPVAVLVSNFAAHLGYTSLVVGDTVIYGMNYPALKITDNGFWVSDYYAHMTHEQQRRYCYLALLGGWPTKDFPTEDA